MTEEEKKEYIEHEIIDRLYYLEEKDFNRDTVTQDYIEGVIKAGKEAKELIDKQQKEIEKLTRLNSAYKTNYYSKVLKEERKSKRILEGYISKDKINAKIEELDDVEIDKITREEYNRKEFAVEILIELLEE